MRRAACRADNIAAAPLAGAGDERHVTVECAVCTNAHFIDHALLALLRLFGRAEPPPQDPHCPAASHAMFSSMRFESITRLPSCSSYRRSRPVYDGSVSDTCSSSVADSSSLRCNFLNVSTP